MNRMFGPRQGVCAHCGRTIEAYTSFWGNRNSEKMFCGGWQPDDPHGGDACVDAAYKDAIKDAPYPVELDKYGRNEKASFAGGLFYYTDG